MPDNAQIEMKVHGVKDSLGSIESKLQDICHKVNNLISKLDEHEEMFKAIEEKLK